MDTIKAEDASVEAFASYFDSGHLLAAMPMSRVCIEESPIHYRKGIRVYGAGHFDVESLRCAVNRMDNTSLAEAQSAASGVNLESFSHQELAVFPCRLDWDAFCRDSHRNHLRFIRTLSLYLDVEFLDVARFRFCRLGLMDTLPARAGIVTEHPMHAAAIVFDPNEARSRMIAGAAFSHILTRGLGLTLEPLTPSDFPKDGEVGRIARHGLSLYRCALEAIDETARFVQCMSLLDFLAYPYEFKPFTDAAKTISRYVASSSTDYQAWLDWFHDITGRKDKLTGVVTGLRTRVVHLGAQIEETLAPAALEQLFRRIEMLVQAIVQHLIEHSTLPWESYLEVRKKMRPFEA